MTDNQQPIKTSKQILFKPSWFAIFKSFLLIVLLFSIIVGSIFSKDNKVLSATLLFLAGIWPLVLIVSPVNITIPRTGVFIPTIIVGIIVGGRYIVGTEGWHIAIFLGGALLWFASLVVALDVNSRIGVIFVTLVLALFTWETQMSQWATYMSKSYSQNPEAKQELSHRKTPKSPQFLYNPDIETRTCKPITSPLNKAEQSQKIIF
jgi:hypothetical protein